MGESEIAAGSGDSRKVLGAGSEGMKAGAAAQTESAVGSIRRAIQRAAADDELGRRLAVVGARVRIHFTDGEVEDLVLLLDRRPVDVVEGHSTNAEIEVSMTAGQLRRFVDGDLYLPMAIMAEGVRYSGPVRKLLRVAPVLQHLASDPQRAGRGGAESRGTPAPSWTPGEPQSGSA